MWCGLELCLSHQMFLMVNCDQFKGSTYTGPGTELMLWQPGII